MIPTRAAQLRLFSPGYESVRASLANVDFGSARALFATYAGKARDLGPWLKDAQINHDNDLRLQYLAGLSFNSSEEGAILKSMVPYRDLNHVPFKGSTDSLVALTQRMFDNTLQPDED